MVIDVCWEWDFWVFVIVNMYRERKVKIEQWED